MVVSNLKIPLRRESAKVTMYFIKHHDKLELIACLTKNCGQSFLGGGKSFQFIERSTRQSNSNSKGLKKHQGRRY